MCYDAYLPFLPAFSDLFRLLSADIASEQMQMRPTAGNHAGSLEDGKWKQSLKSGIEAWALIRGLV
jgi:hypothetical protein